MNKSPTQAFRENEFFQKFNPTPELHIYILRYSCEIKDLFFNDL